MYQHLVLNVTKVLNVTTIGPKCNKGDLYPGANNRWLISGAPGFYRVRTGPGNPGKPWKSPGIFFIKPWKIS